MSLSTKLFRSLDRLREQPGYAPLIDSSPKSTPKVLMDCVGALWGKSASRSGRHAHPERATDAIVLSKTLKYTRDRLVEYTWKFALNDFENYLVFTHCPLLQNFNFSHSDFLFLGTMSIFHAHLSHVALGGPLATYSNPHL